MNLGNKEIELKFERAVKLLTEYMPLDEDRKKPILMHAIRVGLYLYQHNFSADVVIAGLLHDVIEWTKADPEIVKRQFGKRVLEIVQANTQNRAIEDKKEQWRDSVERCAEFGQDALHVKAIDIIDSNGFYHAVKDLDEIARTEEYAKLILEKTPENFTDPIFKKLRTISHQ